MSKKQRHTVLFCGIVMLVVASLGTACSSLKEQTSAHQNTEVRVINRNWLSMEIFVADQGRRERLGRVASGKTKRFKIPAYLLASGTSIRFEMESSGPTPTVLSESLVIKPGEDVVLVIPNTR